MRAAAFVVLGMLTCGVPERPPVPDLGPELDALDHRAHAVAGELARVRRIRAAENEVLLARTRRERERAARALVVARRSP